MMHGTGSSLFDWCLEEILVCVFLKNMTAGTLIFSLQIEIINLGINGFRLTGGFLFQVYRRNPKSGGLLASIEVAKKQQLMKILLTHFSINI